MADAAVLEEMIVRLLGDGSSYSKMLGGAAEETTHAAKVVEHAAGKIEAFQGRLEGFAHAAAHALELLGIERLGHQAFEAFSSREQGIIKMNAALEGNGRAVASTAADYREFAKAQAEVSLTTAGETLSMLTKAEAAYNLTGDAAKTAVKNAIALSNVPGIEGGAESMLRFTQALAKGDMGAAMRFTRMIPPLRGIKNETELLEKAQRLFNLGQKTGEALTHSSEGQIHHLQAAIKGLKADFGAIIAEGVNPIVKELTMFVKLLRESPPEAKRLVVQILAGAAAFLAIRPAMFLARTVLAPFVGLFKLLVIDLIIGGGLLIVQKALWMLWSGAVLAAKVALGLFNLQVAFWNTNISLAAVGTGIWAGAVLIAKAATWLWNAALTATNVLLAPAVLLAAAGTVGILVAAFALGAGVVWGVWQAGKAVFDVLRSLPMTIGPIAHVSGLFAEWGGILRDVVRAAQVDLPVAWRLIQAGFWLAVNQVKDLWPPLWSFIQAGFGSMSQLVATVFQASFLQAITNVLAAVAKASDLFGIWTPGIDREVKKINELAVKTRELAVTIAKAQMKNALAGFKVEESQATKDARAEVDKVRRELDELERKAKDVTPEIKPLPDMDLKVHVKFEAAAFRGSEALARAREFFETGGIGEKGGGGAAGGKGGAHKFGAADMEDGLAMLGSAVNRLGDVEGTRVKQFDAAPVQVAAILDQRDKADPSLPVLKDIRDILNRDAAKPGLNLEFADLS